MNNCCVVLKKNQCLVEKNKKTIETLEKNLSQFKIEKGLLEQKFNMYQNNVLQQEEQVKSLSIEDLKKKKQILQDTSKEYHDLKSSLNSESLIF